VTRRVHAGDAGGCRPGPRVQSEGRGGGKRRGDSRGEGGCGEGGGGAGGWRGGGSEGERRGDAAIVQGGRVGRWTGGQRARRRGGWEERVVGWGELLKEEGDEGEGRARGGRWALGGGRRR